MCINGASTLGSKTNKTLNAMFPNDILCCLCSRRLSGYIPFYVFLWVKLQDWRGWRATSKEMFFKSSRG
jgi:hypothetical protein